MIYTYYTMCGIWAYIASQTVNSDGEKVKITPEVLTALFQTYNAIQHRGPDRSVLTHIPTLPCLLGFHRLAIMDNTVNGDQPFRYQDDERTVYVLCNGEIYNYKQLIRDHDIEVHTHSDCEVILPLYLKYGFMIMMNLINAECAIIVVEVDTKTEQITTHFARDPTGVRPMFMAEDENGFLSLSSELKGVYSVLKRAHPVIPGHMYTYTQSDDPEHTYSIKRELYTDLLYKDTYVYPKMNDKSLDEIKKIIKAAFERAVEMRLDSDRPLAALLSGGLDSSLVCAIAAKYLKKHGKTLKTFSIGMPGATDQYYAELVAKHIGSDHTHVELSTQDFIDAIRDVIWTTETYDITTIRASVGQYLISKWISDNTDYKVLLIGDGSDELTGGYKYFHHAPSPEELHDENLRLLRQIYQFDSLRADRCIARWGLEARVPYLDKDFINIYLHIDPKHRVPIDGHEKWLLRASFDDEEQLLPPESLWRSKEAFSDGISSVEESWHSKLQHCWKEQTTEVKEYEHLSPHTPESQFYRDTFCELFPHAIDDLIIPHFWMPKWTDAKDPSARDLAVYHKDPAET
jgi:asparagine synthase (glutamine-hydrolysing)